MEKINPTIFRAYDIRGVYPGDLNQAVVSRIVLAFVELYPQALTIVVAHDTRKSSPLLAKAVSQALLEAGRKVIYLGTAPDPLFYFSIFHYGFDAGIMISGSHNPPKYNGLTLHIRKTIEAKKGDIILGEMEKIKKLAMSSRKLPARDWSAFGGGVRSQKLEGTGKIIAFNPLADYLDCVTKKIKLARSLKIVIDSGNGAMGYLPQKVFEKLGCRVKTLYGEFDGSFPHHLPDPYIRENRLAAKKEVLKSKFDIGFVYDGDGDRVAAIDNKGRSVGGDFCLLMLSRQALAKKKGPIVHEVRVSMAFLEEMKKRGVKTYFCVSHHTPIIKKIRQVKAVFGGEVTMHFLFPLDWYLCDEALFASLKLAEIASQQNDFAGYVDSLPRYPASPEVFIPCPDTKKFQIIKKLQDYLKANHYKFVDVDGARINFARGWALARAANTTPYIKCRFEGKTAKDLKDIELKSLEIFRKVGIPVTQKVFKELDIGVK